MNQNKNLNLKIGLLNVRSLNTGQDELLASIEINRPDILALNETWIKADEEKFALKVPGYVLKHTPRPRDARGGGVGFYIRTDLRARVMPHPDSSLEQLWLVLSLPGRGRLAIGTAYRPEFIPVSVAIDALNESLNTFAACKHLDLSKE